MKKKGIGFAAAALALCLLLAGCSAGAAEQRTYTVSITEAEWSESVSAAEMLERVRPAVVDVMSYSDTATSAGSGVIIGRAEAEEGGDPQYFIVTNHHVIDGGSSFSVEVLDIAADGSESTRVYDALLVGSSKKRDIAVLTVRPGAGTEFSVASFVEDSDKVKVGTEVFAIGNPLGILGGTVTHGIVSATKRAVSVDEIGTMTLMQTDTAINGGNSGGGLFDGTGKLVGIINSGYDSYNGQSVEGLNFAIPANDAKFAAESLIETHTEKGGKVENYGYVAGDARMDVTFSSASLYTDSTLRERTTCLIAAAASAESPLYSAWGNSVKAVVSVTVNGTTTGLAEGGSYQLTELANAAMEAVKAGDSVTVAYRDVLTARGSGFFGGTYNYLGDALKEAQFTASQYVYEP